MDYILLERPRYNKWVAQVLEWKKELEQRQSGKVLLPDETLISIQDLATFYMENRPKEGR